MKRQNHIEDIFETKNDFIMWYMFLHLFTYQLILRLSDWVKNSFVFKILLCEVIYL